VSLADFATSQAESLGELVVAIGSPDTPLCSHPGHPDSTPERFTGQLGDVRKNLGNLVEFFVCGVFCGG